MAISPVPSLDLWKLVELAAARKTTPTLFAEMIVDLIEANVFTRETLAKHLDISLDQLTQLALCVVPNSVDSFQMLLIAGYNKMDATRLRAFMGHYIDGDFGNIGDGRNPYLDHLEHEYQGGRD